MGLVRSLIRWVAVGRRDGVRSRVREQLGCFTWLDKDLSNATASAPRAYEPEVEPIVPPIVAAPPVGAPWVRLVALDEIRAGEVTEIAAGDRTVALANVGGELFAVDSTCPHAGGPLGDGHLEGCVLTCPWHGWSYDLRTGRSSVDDDVAVATFPVKVVDGVVYLDPRDAGAVEVSSAGASPRN